MTTSIATAPIHGHHDSHESPLRERFKRQVRIETDNCEAKQEACAQEMTVDPSLISHWGARKGCDMPAWRLVAWTRTYGAGLLRWIAAQCGYDLVPREGQNPPRIGPEVLIAHFSGDAGTAVGKTLEDIASGNQWSLQEKLENLPMWLRVQADVNTIVDAIQREVSR